MFIKCRTTQDEEHQHSRVATARVAINRVATARVAINRVATARVATVMVA